MTRNDLLYEAKLRFGSEPFEAGIFAIEKSLLNCKLGVTYLIACLFEVWLETYCPLDSLT